jgi:hypothetical protein
LKKSKIFELFHQPLPQSFIPNFLKKSFDFEKDFAMDKKSDLLATKTTKSTIFILKSRKVKGIE